MDINGVCHIVFCGRLEPRFLGQTVVSIACPCSVLAKPCKSRTFQPLTVHSRPPFPFTLCFLPPVNSGGTVGTVFRPVGLWDKRPAAYHTLFQIPVPVNLCFQRPCLRQNRPTEPLAADRERNGLGAGVGIPIVKEHTVPVLVVTALPADKRICLFSLRRGHAVGGSRPTCALWAAIVCTNFLSYVPPCPCCRSPRKGFLPHSCGVFRRWHVPQISGHFVQKWLVALLPLSGYSFSDGHSIFKVLFTDELSQVYTFLTACAVCP